MLQEIPILAKLCLCLLLVTFVSTAPVSELSRRANITVRVEPRLLETHKITITLDPLPNYTEVAAASDEFLDGGLSYSLDTTNAEEVGIAIIDTTYPEIIEEQGRKDVETSYSGFNDGTTGSAVEDFKNLKNSSSATNNKSTTAPLMRLPMKNAPRPMETDVFGYVITVPENHCPPGYRPDPSGKCREIYGLNSHSLDRSNFLRTERQQKNEMKYGRKFLLY